MVAGENKNMVLGGSALKPADWDRSGFEALRYFIYDPKNGTVFSRTPLSWLQIFVFYLIYYIFLAGFWYACLQVFFLTLPDNEPRWMMSESLIGNNPGMGRRPTNDDLHIDSSIIALDAVSNDNTPTNDKGEGVKNIDWATRMDLFLEMYSNKTSLVNCDDGNPDNHGKCIFDTKVLGNCANSPYGYLSEDSKTVKPCVFLKFNKIWNWVPTPVDPAKLDEEAYSEMSSGLKAKIRAAADTQFVWVDCVGRNPADKEALHISYFPDNQGIPVKYFPYTGGNYHQPLVALQFDTTKLVDRQIDQLIHVECRSWFDGVEHSVRDMSALVRFEFYIKQYVKQQKS